MPWPANRPPPTLTKGGTWIRLFCKPWPRPGLIPAAAPPRPTAPPWAWPCLRKWSNWSTGARRRRENPGFPWGDLLARVRLVAAALLRLQAEDVQAYFQLTRARTQGDPDEMAAALEEAVACPVRIMQQAQEGLALMAQGGAGCAPHLVADLLVACELLGAAFRGAHHIARANLPLMRQDSRRAVWDEDLSHTLDALEAELQQVRAELLGRLACP